MIFQSMLPYPEFVVGGEVDVLPHQGYPQLQHLVYHPQRYVVLAVLGAAQFQRVSTEHQKHDADSSLPLRQF